MNVNVPGDGTCFSCKKTHDFASRVRCGHCSMHSSDDVHHVLCNPCRRKFEGRGMVKPTKTRVQWDARFYSSECPTEELFVAERLMG